DSRSQRKAQECGEPQGERPRSALTTWIELQTSVNCYIDSSKDPKRQK
ncbi:unnamed protein product, partial [Ascophyllum nodosum]